LLLGDSCQIVLVFCVDTALCGRTMPLLQTQLRRFDAERRSPGRIRITAHSADRILTAASASLAMWAWQIADRQLRNSGTACTARIQKSSMVAGDPRGCGKFNSIFRKRRSRENRIKVQQVTSPDFCRVGLR